MQMQDRMGQQFGNYHLIRQIGRGGSAEVYLAEDIRNRNQYAIKVLTATNLKDYQREEFLQEARVVANLQHRSAHIVHVFDFGVYFDPNGVTDSGVPYFVMAYASEGNLRRRHPRGTLVPLERIMLYVKQVAEALQCAHDNIPSVVHLDVKPENMLLRDFNYVWLSDFGIAFTGQTGQLAKPMETVFATVAYMAPERIAGQTRRASDQYSLGVVVYEWLCGQPPFRGTDMEVCEQHVKDAPAPLYPKYPHVTQHIDAVVRRALAKNPDDRYPTIQEFAEALEEAIQAALRQQEQAKPEPVMDITLANVSTVSPMQLHNPILSSQSPLLPSRQPGQPSQPPISASSLLPPNTMSSSSGMQSAFPPLPVQTSSSSQPKPNIHQIADLFAPPQLPSVTQPASASLPSATQPVLSPSATQPAWLPPVTQPASAPLPSATQPASLPSATQPASAPLPSAQPALAPLPVTSLPSATQPASAPLSSATQPASLPGVQSSFPQLPVQGSSPLQSKPDIHQIADLFTPAQSQPATSQAPWLYIPQRRTTRNFFDSSAQFAMTRQQSLFRTSGTILNALSALLLCFLLRGTYTLLGGVALALVGGLYAYYMFRWCILAVEEALAVLFGTMVALYWGFIGWMIGSFLAPAFHQDGRFLSISLAVVFFAASLGLHIRYVSRKSW